MKIFQVLIFITIGFVLALFFQTDLKKIPAKVHSVIATSKNDLSPKLKFYDVLVNNKKIKNKGMPFVLELNTYLDPSQCSKLTKKIAFANVFSRNFNQGGQASCTVFAGPFESLNSAYNAKINFYNHGYKYISLKNNFYGEG